MKYLIGRRYSLILLIIIVFSNSHYLLFSQNPDSTKTAYRFGTNITLTTKGISTIPNLTLGKPAALFEMAVGNKLTFEPQFRFSLKGKPWTFIFWWRYNLVSTEKFRMGMGAKRNSLK
jgi:hypothetical protein